MALTDFKHLDSLSRCLLHSKPKWPSSFEAKVVFFIRSQSEIQQSRHLQWWSIGMRRSCRGEIMRLDSLHVKLKNRLFTNAGLFFATHILLIQLCSTSMAQTPADRYSNEAATRGIDIYSGSVGGFGAGIALLDLDLGHKMTHV